jgi:hypothetical protein
VFYIKLDENKDTERFVSIRIKDNELFITTEKSIAYVNKNVTQIGPKQDYKLALDIANTTVAKMYSCNLAQYSDKYKTVPYYETVA